MRTILATLASLVIAVTSVVAAPRAEGTTMAVSWPRNVVHIQDLTAGIRTADGSPRWPVRLAAERWDDANPVDFRYSSGPCPSGAQCVVVRQAELPAPAVGSAATGRVGADLVSAVVVLDTTFGQTNGATRRRNVVCHELGHALGLPHRTGTSSCMTDQRYPSAGDVRELVLRYGR